MIALKLSKALRAIQEQVIKHNEAVKALLLTTQRHDLIYRDDDSSERIRNY